MAGAEEDDPFLWDVERVIKELCTDDRTWTARAASKMPDPIRLTEQLQSHEIDGEDLLTYDDVWGSKDALLRELDITKASHKLSIQIAIKQFQARSPRYRAWKKSNHHATTDSDVDVSTANPALDTLSAVQNGNRTLDTRTGSKLASPIQDQPRDSPPEPPTKRRRIAPKTVSVSPIHTRSDPVPTEADWFLADTERRQYTYSVAEHAYLGPDKLGLDDILKTDDSESASSKEFVSITAVDVPPGRRRQINAVLRQYLRGNLAGPQADTEIVVDPDDPFLPAFGDSDEEYDEETLREMEQEEEERSHGVSLKKNLLDEVQVTKAIDGVIDDMIVNWRDSKLPKYNRRANKIWNDARRNSTRYSQMDIVAKHARSLEKRLCKLREKIASMSWTSELEVRRQTLSLEQTVHDREHSLWVLGVLNSITEPAKPQSRKRLEEKTGPRRHHATEGDEEILTSDSDDDDDDLIAGDDVATPQPSAQTAMEIDDVPSQTESGEEDLLDLTRAEDNTEDEISFDDPKGIANLGSEHWRSKQDYKRLIITILQNWSHNHRKHVLRFARERASDELWDTLIERTLQDRDYLRDKQSQKSTPKKSEGTIDDVAFSFTKLFDLYKISGKSNFKSKRPLSSQAVAEIRSRRHQFPSFCSFLSGIAQHFPPPREPVKQSPGEGTADGDEDSSISDNETPSPTKQRKRQIIRDQAAQDLRDSDLVRLQEQDQRRRMLHERLKNEELISPDAKRMIINETKEDSQGLIYVHEHIASRIKDHQIQGVRFMWNQIIADAKSRQGCLLAHTMGLGKTMQIVTLLVAITQAACSPDPAIHSQIPEELKESRTLVLCPPGLVGNWMDELLIWAPENMLGDLRTVESSQKEAERAQNVERWAADGGVLIIGYTLFTDLMDNTGLEKLFLERPNIVVGDEAHKLQNPQTKLHKAAIQFRTTTRIAMTGSPLANNVDEYHSMINWVAPNYLGPLKEFREVYTKPIRDGLFKDSEPFQKRKALKMLKVLKETVAPKVHRVTVAALRGNLPPKKEFILYLELSPVQIKAYTTYVRHFRSNPRLEEQRNCFFTVIGDLSLLLAHPKIFRAKLEGVRDELDMGARKPQGKKALGGVSGAKDVTLPRDVVSNLLTDLSTEKLDNMTLSNKMTTLVEILNEARRCKDKVLVFSQHIPTLDYLEDMFKMQRRLYCRLDGNTKSHLRQKQVKDFNTSMDEVFLISTNAGGIGLNIPSANRVVIFDLKFNPIQEQQAIGRAYRIGQEKPVYVYWLLFDGTVEKLLQNQAVFKTQLQSRVVDKKNPIAWAEKTRDYYADPKLAIRQSMDSFRGKDNVLNSVLQSGVGITSIDVTDTFEEQEPEEQLNEEDRKEVDALIKRNQLRWQNPEEYKRQEQEERERQYVHPLAADIVRAHERPRLQPRHVVPVGDRSDQHTSDTGPNPGPALQTRLFVSTSLRPSGFEGRGQEVQTTRSKHFGVPDTPRGMAEFSTGVELPSLGANADDRQDGAVEPLGPQEQVDGAHDRNYALSTARGLHPQIRDNTRPRHEPKASEFSILPIMGAATGFRTPLTPRQTKELKGDGLPPLQGDAQKLVEILRAAPCPPGVPNQTKLAHTIASQVADKLHSDGVTGLPARQKWRKYHGMAEEPGYANLLLTKVLSPTDFVTMSDDELVKKRNTHVPKLGNSSSSLESGRHNDPNHLNSHFPRSLSKAPLRLHGDHAKSDMMAVQDVLDRRARKDQPRKRERLPRWAQDAVNSRASNRPYKAPDPSQIIVIDDDD